MYAKLWRALPGGRVAKTLQCVVLVGLVVTALFLWVFPAVAARAPYEQVTVSPGAATGALVGERPSFAAADASQGERLA